MSSFHTVTPSLRPVPWLIHSSLCRGLITAVRAHHFYCSSELAPRGRGRLVALLRPPAGYEEDLAAAVLSHRCITRLSATRGAAPADSHSTASRHSQGQAARRRPARRTAIISDSSPADPWRAEPSRQRSLRPARWVPPSAAGRKEGSSAYEALDAPGRGASCFLPPMMADRRKRGRCIRNTRAMPDGSCSGRWVLSTRYSSERDI